MSRTPIGRAKSLNLENVKPPALMSMSSSYTLGKQAPQLREDPPLIDTRRQQIKAHTAHVSLVAENEIEAFVPEKSESKAATVTDVRGEFTEMFDEKTKKIQTEEGQFENDLGTEVNDTESIASESSEVKQQKKDLNMTDVHDDTDYGQELKEKLLAIEPAYNTKMLSERFSVLEEVALIYIEKSHALAQNLISVGIEHEKSMAARTQHFQSEIFDYQKLMTSTEKEFNAEKAEYEAEIVHLKQEINSLKLHLEEVQLEHQTAQTKFRASLNTESVATEQLVEAKKVIQELKAKHQSALEDAQYTAGNETSWKRKYNAQVEENSEIREEKAKIEAQMITLKARAETFCENAKRNEESLRNLTDKYDELKTKSDMKDTELHNLNMQLRQNRSENSSVSSEISRLNAIIAQKEKEIKDLNRMFVVISREQEENETDQVDGVRHIVKKIEDQNASSEYGTDTADSATDKVNDGFMKGANSVSNFISPFRLRKFKSSFSNGVYEKMFESFTSDADVFDYVQVEKLMRL